MSVVTWSMTARILVGVHGLAFRGAPCRITRDQGFGGSKRCDDQCSVSAQCFHRTAFELSEDLSHHDSSLTTRRTYVLIDTSSSERACLMPGNTVAAVACRPGMCSFGSISA